MNTATTETAETPLTATATLRRPEPGSRPYVPLTSFVHRVEEAERVNALPPAELAARLDMLAGRYTHVTAGVSHTFVLGEPSRGRSETTLAAKLAARGVLVSQYRNGSYVSQADRSRLLWGEAASVETRVPLGIGTWWPGQRNLTTGSVADPAARLAEDVDPAQTNIVVTTAAAHRPEGAPVTWPYLPSRGAGAAPGAGASQNTHDVITWVRLEDEILRVRAVDDGGANLALTVDRGYFGTAPVAHPPGTRVLSPVYVGSTAAVRWDYGLAGSPHVDRSDRTLRYALKIWQGPHDGPQHDVITWIAGRIRDTFGQGRPAPALQGYNAVWLDITGCDPYNNADAYGHPVAPWADPLETAMPRGQWGAYQIVKLNGLRRVLDEWGYPDLQFAINNLAARGTEGDACLDRLLAHPGVAGAALEHWLSRSQLWEAQMAQHFRIQLHDWPGIYWAKSGEIGPQWTVDQYLRFTYGAYLLAYRPASRRSSYAAPFGLDAPPALFLWQWGAPKSIPTSLDDLRTGNGGTVDESGTLYQREFDNGMVLVNPGDLPVDWTLPTSMWNVSAADRRSQEDSLPTRRVMVGARDAAFLLAVT